MTYREAVAYIHSLLKFGVRPGLERIRALLSALGNPHLAGPRFIHVAGTNGKGTTASMLAGILKEAGYRTGLFVSPYVFDFCERIQLDGQNIPRADLARSVSRVRAAAEGLAGGLEPTEFEAITAAAFLYFAERRCDWAVLEVGLGGRLDSTNVIPKPAAAVVTSISLDHTRILGDTVEKIAHEKCGIIKEGGLVVTTSAQDEKALRVIERTVSERGGRLLVGRVGDAEITAENLSGTDMIYEGLSVHIPLVGRHQVENAVGVITAARALGLPDACICAGVEGARLRGRMELISKEPLTLIDGGHNPECAAALRAVLQKFAPPDVTALVGMMADKDCEGCLSQILPLCRRVFVTVPDNPRALCGEALRELAARYAEEVALCEDPRAACEQAKKAVPRDGLLLVFGSFYLLSDIFK